VVLIKAERRKRSHYYGCIVPTLSNAVLKREAIFTVPIVPHPKPLCQRTNTLTN
jgi:hypothetical protein